MKRWVVGTLVLASALLVLTGCGGAGESAPPNAAGGEATEAVVDSVWRVRRLEGAPTRFRPGGWPDDTTIWGLIGSEVTRLDARTGAGAGLNRSGWSVHAAPGVVAWRNEEGLWVMRDGAAPVLVADAEPRGDADGPPSVLWALDGQRAILSWQAEWDAVHALLEPSGSLRNLDTRIEGYFLDHAALWLDRDRVLFETSAIAPVRGAPGYRESGWRRDLAVLDFGTGAYRLVTHVPDLTYLQVAGAHRGDVLVAERDSAGTRHWLYDPGTWQRRELHLPDGRLYPAPAGGVVVVDDEPAQAVLIAGTDTIALGQASGDAVPSFSPDGVRGVIRTNGGLVLIERIAAAVR